MADTHVPEDEAAELAQRARELNDAIARGRARIRKLQGLPETEGASGGSAWRRLFEVEVETELPALDEERAPAALVDAIHRETGLVGAVTSRGSSFEWKIFDPRIARRKLEVRLEGGDTPRLRISDTAAGAHGSGVFSAILVALLMPLVMVTAMLNIGPVLMMVVTLALTIGAVAAQTSISRRSGKNALTKLAASLGESLPVRGSGVRVAAEQEGEEEHELEVDEAAETEAEHGLS